jgi:3-deoxy-manno-octulosonate cytidylyltransferase (CMP-KDO synthetase)
VIPARYASTRLPGKALLPIGGKPMLQWVHERARAATTSEVWIATDDTRIAECARGFGAAVVMTAAHHASGTDRVAEVARLRGWDEREIVVNAQGDEPLLPPELIRQAAGLLVQFPAADIATLAAPINSLAEFLDTNAVKVVTDLQQRALYFSRAPIPWQRDGAPTGLASQSHWLGARRHVGLYAYRVGALHRLAALAPTALEQAEKLEQLRALESGFDIRVAHACVAPGPDVNTSADLQRVSALLASRG